jgi:aryl-alcohol dehydrogenase-like predicted oxidoreductase
MLEVCARHRLGIVAYNVLAQGLLSGKYDESNRFPDDDRRSRLPLFQGQQYRDALLRVAQIGKEAAAQELTAVQHAIRWVLAQPRVTSAIVGIKSVKQLEENAAASGAAVL